MKRKDEEVVVTPDSANISDMQTNDDDDERAESRERSRGKRRTAREIASMFEQLKQRHITRKKEWQDEKDDLVKKVQMAEESKKVLSELKGILESLREELKHEERKRIEMEMEHESEKRNWHDEKEDLLKRIEESSQESEKDGTEVAALSEQLAEQTEHLAEWQKTVLDLKKQLLEKENRFLRERRELQLELEKERASWQKKEMQLSERIRLLDAKSGQSSASSISPAVTPLPAVETDTRDTGSARMVDPKHRKKSSSVQEASTKYDNFQKTVDNALKQIEKISNDLRDIEEPRPAFSSLHPQGTRRSSLTPSPIPKSPSRPLKNGSAESDPSITAPWRTKKRSTTVRPTVAESTHDVTEARKASPQQATTSPTGDVLLPAINTAQLKMSAESRSPNPERKVKKIDRRGSQVDVIVSSPDSNTQKDGTAQPGSDHFLSDNGSPITFGGTESRSSKYSSSTTRNRDTSNTATPTSPKTYEEHHHNAGLRHARLTSREGSVGGSYISPPTATDGMYARSPTQKPAATPGVLDIQESESGRARSNSPRLPKLHQQLLFRKDFQAGAGQEEYSSAADGRKTSVDEPKPRYDSSSSGVRRTISVDKSEPTPPGSGARYGVGRRRGQVGTGPSREEKVTTQTKTIGGQSAKVNITFKKPHIGGALVSLGTSLVQGDKNEGAVPPVVHPKPKVSIHKDYDGNILRVSPEVEPVEPARKHTSPESIPGSEKHYSIAGRVGNVGKAGRDWIRKKLSFREKKGEEVESDEKNRGTPSTGDALDENKRHGKSKSRSRSSSLLRNGKHSGKAGNRRSLAGAVDVSSDDSTESDREGKKRESFLRRSRKKGKKLSAGGGDSKETTPTKSRPKKYTRSKTEASTKDMKNFLAKFKASQSNPNKPSVVKQFEKRLLENETKSFQEFETGSEKSEKDLESAGIRNGTGTEQIARKKSLDEGYSGEDEEDYDNWSRGDFSPIEAGRSVVLPTLISYRDETESPTALALRVGKKGPPVKPKTYHRRSMSDFKQFEDANHPFRASAAQESNIVSRRRRDRNEPKFISELPTIHSPSTAAQEAGELCSRKAVSSLVDKFSLKDDRVPEQAKITRGAAARYSFRDPSTELDGKTSPQDGAIQRSRSMSSHDAANRYGRRRANATTLHTRTDENETPADNLKNTASHRHTPRSTTDSWLDRVMLKPSDEANGPTEPAPKDFVQALRIPAPPGQYDFFENSFVSGEAVVGKPEPDVQTSPKPGRMKMMSAEMRRKADMLEKALVKGPRKPRKYKRADTQPVHSYYDSSDDDDDLSDTEKDLDRAFQPFIAEFRKTDGLHRTRTMPEDVEQDMDGLHDIIPPVTSKFSKPHRPGRLPSRWAR